MENPLSQNLLFLVMADISAIGPERVLIQMLHRQDDWSPYLSSLRLGFWLVLQTEIVVFRLFIRRRLQNGLTS